MKGGWAGAKVASASEEPGDARRTPVTSRRYGGERPHPRGGGTGVTGAADRSAQRAVSRAESFPHKGEIRSLSRIHHAEPRPAHARPKAPRGTLSF